MPHSNWSTVSSVCTSWIQPHMPGSSPFSYQFLISIKRRSHSMLTLGKSVIQYKPDMTPGGRHIRISWYLQISRFLSLVHRKHSNEKITFGFTPRHVLLIAEILLIIEHFHTSNIQFGCSMSWSALCSISQRRVARRGDAISPIRCRD